MKKSLFNFAATMLMSAGAVVFNACSDDNTDSDGGVGTLEVTPASLETIADYGGSFSFDVRSNSYWHVSVEDADELPLVGVCRYRFRHGKCVGQSFGRNQRRAGGSDRDASFSNSMI